MAVTLVEGHRLCKNGHETKKAPPFHGDAFCEAK
jgi:hypothetical protein